MGFDWLTGLGAASSLLGGLSSFGQQDAMRRKQLALLDMQLNRQRRYSPGMDSLLYQTITSGGKSPNLLANRLTAQGDISRYYDNARADATRGAYAGGDTSGSQNLTLALARARASDMAGARTSQLNQEAARADEARNLLFSSLQGNALPTASAYGDMAAGYGAEGNASTQTLGSLLELSQLLKGAGKSTNNPLDNSDVIMNLQGVQAPSSLTTLTPPTLYQTPRAKKKTLSDLLNLNGVRVPSFA